ncbi:MAG TPA: glycerophosphodiester phosphodiesterase [Candidatus Sulfotelmatobacter sp.]|nr:glycerophosphodiester phosphodiesterase [Candidatus Sulfotelmatobacter sp.]
MEVIGHRGAKGLADENTIASIKAALNSHVDGVEIDVRVTKDKAVVLAHDVQLGKYRISDTNLSELKSFQPELASLSEAIEAAKGTFLAIEVKAGVDLHPVAAEINKCLGEGLKLRQFGLGSKQQKDLVALKKLFPSAKLIVIEPYFRKRAWKRARELGADTIFINARLVSRRYLNASKAKGFKLYPYSVNSPGKAERLVGYGAVGVISDYPDRFKKAGNL